MSWTEKIGRMFGRKAIAESELRHPGHHHVWFDFAQAPDLREMEAEIGDGTNSDVLMTPINWLCDSFLEAPVIEVDEEGNPAPGELEALLNTPNEFYAWEHLIAGTIYSLCFDGNAYWIKVADGNGKLSELWYAPHTLIEPKWLDEAGEFVGHYEYSTGGVTQLLEVEDVVHFRRGMDPHNVRKGLSRLKGLLRTVWTDKEISVYSSAILKNSGVGGVVIMPDSADQTITPEEADATEQRINARITRSRRGTTLVFRTPARVEKIGFSPAELDLSPLGNRAEERVCAALGVQAAVVGFGSGMEQTKVGATMKELRALSYMGGILPLQRIIEGEIDRSIAPDFKSAGIMFDNEQVAALREDQDSRSRRVTEQFRAGILTRGEAKAELGHEVDEGDDDVYLLPFSTQIVPANAAPTAPLAEVVSIGQRGAAEVGEEKGEEIDLGSVVYVKGLWDRLASVEVGDHATPDGWMVVGDEMSPTMHKRTAWHAKSGRTLYLSRMSSGIILATEENVHKWLNAGEQKQEHSLLEQTVAARRSRKPPAVLRRLADALDALRLDAEAAFSSDLERLFADLGRSAGTAAREVLSEQVAATMGEAKQEQSPEQVAQAVMEQMNLAESTEQLAATYGRNYVLIAQEVASAMSEVLGIAIEITDPMQLEILRGAGTRAGLVDLEAQTRREIFDALLEGRERGLAGDNLARLIREHVEAGPWSSAEVRARVIARTEGAYAANTSVLEGARAIEDVEMMMVHDNRTGHNDEICSAMDGTVVTLAEAQQLIADEHPNGTRSLTPIPPLLLEEMMEEGPVRIGLPEGFTFRDVERRPASEPFG